MYGLVLEGGGARGAYHLGVYKAILEEGIEIGGITGTSIGAINGAMIVQGDFQVCYDLWKNLSYSMLVDDSEYEIEKLKEFKFEKEELLVLANYLRTLIADRGLDIKPLKRMLDTYIYEDKIRNSQLDFGLVTVNLTDLKSIEIFKEDIPVGEIKNYLLASSYLPVFATEKIGGKRYLDGAFYDNLPFNMLKEKGYENQIIVRTHAAGIVRRVNMDNINAIIISPSEDIGKTYTLNAKQSQKNLELGYYDGLRAFRKLKGDKYYIEVESSSDYYTNLLLDLGEYKVGKISKLLKIPELPYNRRLFEHIIPKLGSLLNLEKDFSYEELLIGLLEIKASHLKIERFQIYGFKDLLYLVRNEKLIKPKPIEHLTTFEKFIDMVDISSLFNNDDIILQIANIIFDEV
jgi:NTE family protein